MLIVQVCLPKCNMIWCLELSNSVNCISDELLQAKEKYKTLSDELESTLTDISGM